MGDTWPSQAAHRAMRVLCLLTLCELLCSSVPSAQAREPVFLSRKAAPTKEYTLHSTYVNPSPSALLGPARIDSKDGRLDITLTVEEARIHVADLFDFNARAFCWQSVCRHPAPSI